MNTPIIKAALQFRTWGASVTAIGKESKKPIHKWACFYETPQTDEDARSLPWRSAVGCGVLNGPKGWHTFDTDKCPGNAPVDSLIKALGLPSDYRWVWRSGSGTGWEVAFICHDDLPAGVLTAKATEPGVFWGLPKDGTSFDHIELRWDRCQTIYPPSQSADPDGPGYKWRSEAPDAPPAVVDVGHVLAAFFAVAVLKPSETPLTIDRPSRERTPSNTNDSTTAAKEEIRRRFDLVAYAKAKFGGEARQEPNGEIRILGHGGLIIRPDKDIWNTFQDKVGGDCFDLAGKHLFDGRWDRTDGRMFMDALKEAADYTGVTLPKPDPAHGLTKNGAPLGPDRGKKAIDDQAEPPARRYLTEDEIDTLRPPTWLIKGVIAAGEVTLISGPGDAGKTFIATDMMKRVAQHYPVMYAALEDAPGIRIRKRAWEMYHQMPKNGNFLMWTHALDLFDPASVDSFIAEVLPLGLRMITIDTLSRGLGGADENSNTDMAIVMNQCERIAHETGAAVDLLHHTTKDGQAYRGASALKNNTYGHIEISRDDDLIQFKIGRIKNTSEQAPRYFKLVSVPLPDVIDADGNQVSSAVILPADRVATGDRITGNQVRMLETLMLMTDVQGGASTTELAKATGLVGNSFYSALKRLRSLGLITKGENARDPLTITGAGRARLSVESANPEHQPDGRPVITASPFEVNPHLDTSLPSLPSLPGSEQSLPNDPGSDNGSETPETEPTEAITTTSLPEGLAAPGAETTITTKSLPNTIGSNDNLLPTYHTPLGVVVGSNRGSDGLSHDQRRQAEVDKALRENNVKGARAAADKMQGNRARAAAYQKIEEHIAAGAAS